MTTAKTYMDDPTTYLDRDPSLPVLMVAGSQSIANEMLKFYGVRVQSGGPIHVLTTTDDVFAAVQMFPPETPWCIVADGVTDSIMRQAMRAKFGPVKPIYQALGVETRGVAWRKEMYERG